jgi:hypothetical protein
MKLQSLVRFIYTNGFGLKQNEEISFYSKPLKAVVIYLSTLMELNV